MSVLVLKNCNIINRLIPGSQLICVTQQKIGLHSSLSFSNYNSYFNISFLVRIVFSIRFTCRYDIKAPGVFKVRQVGKTLVNRTAGTKIASEGLKGRVFEVSLADLQNENDAERSFRKFKLIVEDVQGKNCLTTFYGMNLTTDKLRSMVKKWQTLVEGNVDVKTTDGYMLRVFCIGFTRKQDLSTKKTCYAQSAQVKNIRKKMVDIIQREVGTTDLKEVVNKLIPDSIARDIEKACQGMYFTPSPPEFSYAHINTAGIYPLHDVHIRKVKVMKRPRFDLTKLMDMHHESSGKTTTTTDPNTGEVVERPEGYEPPVQEAV